MDHSSRHGKADIHRLIESVREELTPELGKAASPTTFQNSPKSTRENLASRSRP